MKTSKSPTLSIIVATKGRTTLGRTLEASASQLEHGDEILVICRHDAPWGHASRNEAMDRSAGEYLLFIDDDDFHLPGALSIVREALRGAPGRVHLFAMRYAGGSVLEPYTPIGKGSLGTPMFVVPNVPDLLGRWSARYEGDWDFIEETMRLRGDEAVAHTDVIAEVVLVR